MSPEFLFDNYNILRCARNCLVWKLGIPGLSAMLHLLSQSDVGSVLLILLSDNNITAAWRYLATAATLIESERNDDLGVSILHDKSKASIQFWKQLCLWLK